MCTVGRFIDVVGDKWTLRILCEAAEIRSGIGWLPGASLSSLDGRGSESWNR
jgi:DNA-binding HxlR family transcriptional regulator